MSDEPEDKVMKTGDANVAKRIQQYVLVRDKLKELDERQAKERKPLLEIQMALTGLLQAELDRTGGTGIRTPEGSCYTTTRHSASLADADAFMKYVIENKLFDLLDRRANATSVKEYVLKHNQLPPGCNLTALKTVNVRRPTTKKASPLAE